MRALLGIRQAPLIALGLCGVLLTGCGDGDSSGSDQAATVTETVTATESATGSQSASADDTEGDDPDATSSANSPQQAGGLPPRPRRDECVEVTTPRDGRYTVYDAGKAVVRRSGDTLRIRSLNAAQGWRARVTERGGDDDVEIEFRPAGRGAVLELEVELDDGGVESQICADDRDRDDDPRDRDDRDD